MRLLHGRGVRLRALGVPLGATGRSSRPSSPRSTRRSTRSATRSPPRASSSSFAATRRAPRRASTRSRTARSSRRSCSSPRRRGRARALTHRLVALFGAARARRPRGRAAARRAAEPRLDAWLAQMVGDLRSVRLRAEFVDGDGHGAARPRGSPARRARPLEPRRAVPLARRPRPTCPPTSSGCSSTCSCARAGGGAGRRARRVLGGPPSGLRAPPTSSLGEFLELNAAFRQAILGARTLDAPDFHEDGRPSRPPPTAPSSASAPTAPSRRCARRTTRSAARRGRAADPLRDALVDLVFLGIPEAVPGLGPRRRRARTDAQARQRPTGTRPPRRLDQAQTLAPGSTATGASRRARDQARAGAARGGVRPRLQGAAARAPDERRRARRRVRRSDTLLGDEPLEALSWLQGVSRVRPGASRLSRALTYAAALRRNAALALKVAQLPSVAGERWVALPAANGGPPELPPGQALARRPPAAGVPAGPAARRARVRRVGRARARDRGDDRRLLQLRRARRAPAADRAARGRAARPDALAGRDAGADPARDAASSRSSARSTRRPRRRPAAAARAAGARTSPATSPARRSRPTSRGRRGLGMASITFWTRLEPFARLDDIDAGLQAQTHDPLWLLARQWQTGEFQGEDAGTPGARAARARALAARALPRPGPRAGSRSRTAATCRSRRSSSASRCSASRDPRRDLRVAADAGLYFLRLLERFKVSPRPPAFAGAPKLAARRRRRRPEDDDAGRRYLAVMLGRVPDGYRVYQALAPTLRRAAQAAAAPRPSCPPPTAPKAVQAGLAFLDWFDARYSVAPAPARRRRRRGSRSGSSTRSPSRPRRGGGELALSAPEYPGGALEWHSFDVDRPRSSARSRPTRRPSRVVRTVVPAPVRYAGMAADRFWELEDGQVNLNRIEGDPDELLRLLLVEFALRTATTGSRSRSRRRPARSSAAVARRHRRVRRAHARPALTRARRSPSGGCSPSARRGRAVPAAGAGGEPPRRPDRGGRLHPRRALEPRLGVERLRAEHRRRGAQPPERCYRQPRPARTRRRRRGRAQLPARDDRARLLDPVPAAAHRPGQAGRSACAARPR